MSREAAYAYRKEIMMGIHDRGYWPPPPPENMPHRAHGMAPTTRQIDDVRRAFIRRTYVTVGLSILAFIGIEAALLSLPGIVSFAHSLVRTNWTWLLVLGLFSVVSMCADKLARSEAGTGVQLTGLGLYIAALAVIFLPVVVFASISGEPGIMKTAGLITLATVCGLTTFTLMTGTNFSWLRGILVVGSFTAIGAIVASLIFNFTLGTLFAGAFVLLGASALLYQTSALMYDWNSNQHIAAALGIFSSIMLIFYYILIILMPRN